MTSPTSSRLRGSQCNSLHYQAFPAITHGIQFLNLHMPYLPQRLTALHHWLCECLSNLRYPNTAPFVRILTGLPARAAPPKTSLGTSHLMTPPSTPAFAPPPSQSCFARRRRINSEASSVDRSSASYSALPVAPVAGAWGSSVSVTSRLNAQGTYGYIITCIFLSPSGKRLRPAHSSKRAAQHNVHLSTSSGHMCTSNGIPRNQPRGRSPLNGRDVCDGSDEDEVVVRMSLGMGSDFRDIWNILRWATSFLEEEILEHELVSWRTASASQPRLLSP